MEKEIVVGANKIAQIVGRSLREIVNLHLYEDLPMYLEQGIWKAEKTELERFVECKRNNEVFVPKAEEEEEKPKSGKERKEEINAQLEELGAETLTYNNGITKFEKALEEALAVKE